MKTTTKPVGAFLTEEEFTMFKKAAEHTGQMVGEAARFAMMPWAKTVLGVRDETDYLPGLKGAQGQEESHPESV